ncbi:hypothetical protein PHMEG_00029087 [Phytophthora megakarya]|uniref:Uncharacterized protein n=1 Tax=Phytophthora megakarya TaxID=4795 RepID=A0A225V2W1_9STRA|nr:hypothetical protein PHMEG_00029087 [Phytophthora megakarya]
MLQHGYVALDVTLRTIEIQEFLRSVISKDIITPEFIGLKVFMQQWDFFSRLHAEVDVRADRLQLFTMEGAAKTYPSLAVGDPDEAVYVVKSTGMTTVRISRLTIEHIFPCILADEELVQHLIGKTYSFSFTIYFHISTGGCIFQMESRVDLSSSFFTLLDDHDAAKMIRESAILPSGNLAVQDEVHEARNVLANSYL